MGIKRNVFCPHYSDCLDQAVETGKNFNCGGCKHEYERSAESQSDTFGCYLLIIAVYFPEIYKSYRRIEKAGDIVILNRSQRLIMDFFDDVLSKL